MWWSSTFENHERRLDSHYGTPVPGVRIELKHIRAAMDKQAAEKLLLIHSLLWTNRGQTELTPIWVRQRT